MRRGSPVQQKVNRGVSLGGGSRTVTIPWRRKPRVVKKLRKINKEGKAWEIANEGKPYGLCCAEKGKRRRH